ncbi:MAG TPA: M1 family peptidase, partial [Cyclobacteriaceae bacterium]|nr:M1 family peptidase [Cyclobacteriaceae bacterium]
HYTMPFTITDQRYPQYPHTTPESIVPFMKGDQNTLRPVMTTSDNDLLSQFGNNYYNKPTVALTILRETVVGEQLFDVAFKEYANRWKYKHPNPADLFRTLEDVTAVDLDWFWRGWFFTTDKVDVEVDQVKWFKVKNEMDDPESKSKKIQQGDLSTAKGGNTVDFSSGPQEITMTSTDGQSYGEFLSRIDETTVRKKLDGKNLYEVTLNNKGGLVAPVIIEWTYKDGSKEIERIPAEIWRLNESQVKKVFVKDKEVTNIVIDPNKETADVNTDNNLFPKKESISRFEEFKKKN